MSRPCLYLIPSRQNTDPSPRQIQQLVFSLERAVDMMPRGVETLALLVDFKHSSNSKNPSVGTGRQVLHILQTHYPERLGKALVINGNSSPAPLRALARLTLVPTFVWLFFKLIMPFIDPNTREKLKFNEDLRGYVPPDQLLKLFGGDCDFEYEHERFWPVYVGAARERRERYFARWKALGGRIGLSEWDVRGKGEIPVEDEVDENGVEETEQDTGVEATE
jgi:phosphatidylinositol/phosphatidylcholine transfer protein